MNDVIIKIKLSELLIDVIDIDSKIDREITGLAIDSRQVRSGDLFIAYPGAKMDGRDYIDDAIKNGAVAILCEKNNFSKKSKYAGSSIPVIYILDLKRMTGTIAAKFYSDPTKDLKVIGVTGTNGKTSCTFFLASTLRELNYPCGVIGTLGMGFPDKLTATNNTTPDSLTLQKEFAKFKREGAKAVAMEVSSVGLEQERLKNVNFALAVFTNLTRDHLDYHLTMEDYAEAKKKLFTQFEPKYAVINADDEFGRQLLDELSKNSTTQLYAYTTENNDYFNIPTIKAAEISLSSNGIAAKIISPWGSGILQSSLLGKFNLSNLLAVLTALGVMGFSFQDCMKRLSMLKPFGGRMQPFGGGKTPLVVVDYAHTPDGLEKALSALREHCRGRLWCVFGCGGERDRGKRPLMGQIAERLCDHVIITDDNPRSEDSQRIVDDIVSGLVCPWAVEIEHDRRIAISHAIHCAQTDDVVLVAGKGHESYQIIGNEKLPFNDADVVLEVLEDL